MARSRAKRKYTRRVQTSKQLPEHLQVTKTGAEALLNNFRKVHEHNVNKFVELCSALSAKVTD